ncbi:hypothetical protein, partial [Burkholderia sp. Ac-20392]|uniref:hypothetical protein n=1 Tax=Burkholderia sp. Ac-20392 TaxID=2703905 RepID=UPI00197DA3C9
MQRLHLLDGRRHATADDHKDIRRRLPSGRPPTDLLAPASLAYRNVACNVCICSTVAVTPPQTIT